MLHDLLYMSALTFGDLTSGHRLRHLKRLTGWVCTRRGLHFLVLQKDEEADLSGIWLLQDKPLPSI